VYFMASLFSNVAWVGRRRLETSVTLSRVKRMGPIDRIETAVTDCQPSPHEVAGRPILFCMF
jgi:hypothetical protein